MPLLGACHIPQAQEDQLGPSMQASFHPCDLLLRSSYLPLHGLKLPWDSSLALGASCSQARDSLPHLNKKDDSPWSLEK